MSEARDSPSAEAVPRLPRGVRLFHDEARDRWTLLAPERILEIDDVALAILQRCDGVASVGAIVDDLALSYEAERSEIDADVRAFIRDLAEKRMLDL